MGSWIKVIWGHESVLLKKIRYYITIEMLAPSHVLETILKVPKVSCSLNRYDLIVH